MLTPPSPPPASPRNRPLSFWLALGFGLLFTGSLVLNALLGVALVGARESSGESGRYEEILVDGKRSARDKVVVLPIHGVIMEEGDGPGSVRMVSQIRSMLRSLEEDRHVKALVLDIDSPGGGVTASDQIYHELARFRKEKGIPVVSLFGDVAASGGYYVAMASDHLVAHGTSITGSIGVISQFPQVSELMDRVGVEITTIKSLNDQGRTSFKDIGSPFRKMRPEEHALLQDLITRMWERFVGVVAEGRKGRLDSRQIRKLADGRIFTGDQALELKLVDSVGYQEDAFQKARELGHAPDARVVRLRHRESLADLLGGLGVSSPTPPDLRRLLERTGQRGPRLLYLWSGS